MKRRTLRVMRLRAVRRQREMTQAELGARVGLDESTICSIENGKRQPSLAKARKLAAALGLSIEEMFSYIEIAS